MTNLVPQIRPDVNGKLVTRHVKTDSSNSPTVKLPPPVLSTQATDSAVKYESDLNHLRDAVTERFIQGDYSGNNTVSLLDLCKQTDNLGPTLAGAFRKQIEDSPDMGYEELLICVLNSKLRIQDASFILFVTQIVNGEDKLESQWDEDINGIPAYSNSWEIYRGLTEYGRYKLPGNIYEVDEAKRRGYAAITELLHKGSEERLDCVINDWGSDVIYLEDSSLGDVAMDHPTEVDRIISIIQGRGTADPDAIRTVLSADVQPLSDGIL